MEGLSTAKFKIDRYDYADQTKKELFAFKTFQTIQKLKINKKLDFEIFPKVIQYRTIICQLVADQSDSEC